MKSSGLRSSTYTTLSEFADWLGLTPHFTNGLFFDSDVTKNNTCKDCDCIYEYPYQSKYYFSRTELRMLLDKAEHMFINKTSRYPSATQIYNERQDYRAGKFGLLTKQLHIKAIDIDYKCDDLELGVAEFDSLETIDITAQVALIDDTITDIDITTSISIANLKNSDMTTIKDRLLLLNTNNDLLRVDDTLDLNNIKKYAIRPYNYVLAVVNGLNLDITINVSTSLLKRPSLDGVKSCCVNVGGDCYVTEIELFELFINKCRQGSFICSESDCSSLPCVKTRVNFCATYNENTCSGIIEPQPITCTYNETTDSFEFAHISCVECHIEGIEINYISGNPLECFRIEDDIQEAIFKIAVGIAFDGKRFCDCDIHPMLKWGYYSEFNVVKTSTTQDTGGQYEVDSQFVLTKDDLAKVDGYNPKRGLLEGLSDIDNLICCEF